MPDTLFGRLHQLGALFQIRILLLDLQLHLAIRVVERDLRLFEHRPRLFHLAVSGAPIPDRPSSGRAENVTAAHVVNVLADGGAANLGPARRTDLWKIAGARNAHLLRVAQDDGLLLLEERPAFLRQFDRLHQGNMTRMILQLAHRFQGRAITPAGIEIEAEGFRELKLRDPIIILRADQERILVGKGDLRLEDVEPRDGTGLEPVLLILQLALEEVHRFFLHQDQLAIQQDLVKLLAHRGDDKVDRIAKRVIAAVPRKIGRANLRNNSAAGKDDLRRLKANVVGPLDAAETIQARIRTAYWSSRRDRSGRRCDYVAAVIHLKVGIDVLELPRHPDLRQNLRAHLDVEALGPLDFLPRFPDVGILLQRREDRLVEGETRNDGVVTRVRFDRHIRSREKEWSERQEKCEERGKERDLFENFSHGWKTQDGQIQVGDGTRSGALALGGVQAACRILYFYLKLLSNSCLKI